MGIDIPRIASQADFERSVLRRYQPKTMQTKRGGFVHLGVRQSRRTSKKNSPSAAHQEQAPGGPRSTQHDTPQGQGAPLSYGHDEIEINGWRVFPAPWAWPNWWAVIPPEGHSTEAFLETDFDLAVSAVLRAGGAPAYSAWRQLQLDLPEVGQ